MSILRNSVGLPTTKGLVEKYRDYNQYDDMVVKVRVPEKDDSRNKEDVNELATDFIENGAIRHSQKQQWDQPQPQVPKRPAIHWENFLPLRSLKVLLVENDDSTRYAVSALLRNCSYEVTAVSNGLEAWETLEDLTNRVDLVLTEVAMPCLSGIDLLSKIMSDKTCNNIPVIMMSSNDSMNIVFKCLSNGAVDFLVKPIRKNELKNLWQHVWRKCHGSGGGSGSESGVQTQNSTKSKSVDGSNNDTDLNYEEGNGSTGLTFRNGSDNDSGNQSACSKRTLEVHCSEPIAQLDDMANLPDSTSENRVSANTTGIIRNEGDEHDDVTLGKDLTLAAPITPELQLRNPLNEVLAEKSNTGGVSKFLDLDMNKDPKKQGKEVVEDNTLTTNSDINLKDDDTPVSITNDTISRGEIARNEFVSDSSKVKHVDSCNGKEPSLELGLQRLRDVGSSFGTNAQTHNILRRSDHSAFSRYNATSTNKQACSSVNRSLEAGKFKSMQHLQREISRTQNQGSNGSSNNFDMGSTSNYVSDLHREIRVTSNQGSKGSSSNNFDMGSTSNCVSDKPESLNDKSIPRSTISVDNCHAFPPVRHGHCQTGISDTAKTVTTQGMAMHQQPQVEHHHHHHHVRGIQQQQMSLDSNDLSSGNIIDAALHCGKSNKLGIRGIEGNAANYESASGSNNGSNGSNGRNSIVGGTNVAVDDNTPGVCVSGSGNKSGTEQDRLALREAALIKFRQKRKDRCFEKKVRYQSRKKLAEQRPRVRGQFVKQTADENKNNDYV